MVRSLARNDSDAQCPRLPMLTRHRLASILALTVIASCAGLSVIRYCPPAVICLRALIHFASLGSALFAVALLASTVVASWTVLTGWTIIRSWRNLSQLNRVVPPRELAAAASRVGVARLVCLKEDGAAFCAGSFRPTVFISRSLVGQLKQDALDAVLLHEQDHARRREPLRRVGAWAATQALFFVPVVAWWARRGVEAAELRADQAAVVRLGRAPVAAALLLLGSDSSLAGTAAFTGFAQLRVAQLLGDPLPRHPLPLKTVVLSGIGLYSALAVMACVAGSLASIG